MLGDKGNEIKSDQITLRVGDCSVVKAEVDPKGVITVTAKGEGDSKVYVEYAGQTIDLDVTANKEAVAAVEAAKNAELKKEAETKIASLETAANKDLTQEGNLTETAAKTALEKLSAGTEGLAELTSRFNVADKKVKDARVEYDKVNADKSAVTTAKTNLTIE
ncbi:hypothetical protein AB2T14_002417 [Clostridium botulinum]